MVVLEDFINFDLIEGQKENIQFLFGGWLVKKLVEFYFLLLLYKFVILMLIDIKNINDCICVEYEVEIVIFLELDDFFDVFD